MWIDILHRVDIKFFLFGLYIGFKLVSCDEESMSLSLRCQSHTKNNETSFMVDGALWSQPCFHNRWCHHSCICFYFIFGLI